MDEYEYDCDDELPPPKNEISPKKKNVDKDYTFLDLDPKSAPKRKPRIYSEKRGTKIPRLNNDKPIGKTGRLYGFRSIVLALNNMENEEFRQQAIKAHEYMCQIYSEAVETRDKDRNDILSKLDSLYPDGLQTHKKIKRAFLHVQEFILRYIEDPIRTIVVSARLAKDKANPHIRHVALPAKTEEYYDVYLAIEEQITRDKEKGEGKSLTKTIEAYLDDKTIPKINYGHDSIEKAYKDIKSIRKFYAKQYKQLFGEEPFKDITQL